MYLKCFSTIRFSAYFLQASFSTHCLVDLGKFSFVLGASFLEIALCILHPSLPVSLMKTHLLCFTTLLWSCYVFSLILAMLYILSFIMAFLHMGWMHQLFRFYQMKFAFLNLAHKIIRILPILNYLIFFCWHMIELNQSTTLL